MLARVLRMENAEEIKAFMQKELVRAGLGRVVPSRDVAEKQALPA